MFAFSPPSGMATGHRMSETETESSAEEVDVVVEEMDSVVARKRKKELEKQEFREWQRWKKRCREQDEDDDAGHMEACKQHGKEVGGGNGYMKKKKVDAVQNMQQQPQQK